MRYAASPNDTRYIPFTQQAWCCVPVCIQMIMYRHGIPLVPAEEIGYHLGLTVPPDQAALFYNVRTSKTPPSGAGYGTLIQESDYGLNAAFMKLDIPLRFSIMFASEFASPIALIQELRRIGVKDEDALLCYNPGVIGGEYKPNTGHVVVFDRVVDGKVRAVDPSTKHPKWHLIDPELLYEAITKHGNENSGGIWRIAKKHQPSS